MEMTERKFLEIPLARAILISLLVPIALPMTSCVSPGTSAAEHAPLPLRADTARGEQFVVIYRPGSAWRAGRPVTEQDLREHFFFLKALYESGRITLAGPFLDDSGGMLVLRAGDLADAAQTVAADPAVSSGVMTGEVRPFRAVFDAARALPRVITHP